MSIPGTSSRTAEFFIAETGADMSVFPTPQQMASWAGTAPGSNESAGQVNSAKTRPGNRSLKGALGIAVRTKRSSSRPSARYRWERPRRM